MYLKGGGRFLGENFSKKKIFSKVVYFRLKRQQKNFREKFFFSIFLISAPRQTGFGVELGS